MARDCARPQCRSGPLSITKSDIAAVSREPPLARANTSVETCLHGRFDAPRELGHVSIS
jgi:hypothetical protein